MTTSHFTDDTPRSFLRALVRSLKHPGRMPEGVNDWDTPLPESGPGAVPVVLIHGTWMNSYGTWGLLAPLLADDGRRVFTVDYGKDPSCWMGRRAACFANAPLLVAQTEVAAFIDEVLERTGAAQVDLIGHSQGGAQARLYLTESGGAGNPADGVAPKVRHLIGIAGSNHGTTMSGLGTLGAWLLKKGWYGPFAKVLGGCAEDQMVGSDFMAHLNRDGDTVPGVDYTMICSRYDEVVTPWRTQQLVAGEGATVRNELVQENGNRLDFSEHLSLLYSPRCIDLVRECLDDGPAGAYRSRTPHVTGTVLPFLGALRWRNIKRVETLVEKVTGEEGRAAVR
ncbi:esterase/lipase family protein [Corynebacterium terpenotabidum]|uniref:Triacylglycerol lipase n=1 Tax=Corynebacterium terpenotabidum Y-11 TaxID=1200352 RepID=S4XEQ6_9CORY|nr:alpha/beta fold hydrolase [Corynebacterium terpenotabidum]AGP31627.1 triacylglycerol lipase [Corynebacterium terpenotabidum Y-11]